jgi:hypothetical protein
VHDEGEKVANNLWERFIRDQWAPPPLAAAA